MCAAARRIPSHVSAVCAQPCVHTRVASLCSESSPRFVQTSPSRLAGASALTSPIHRSLDACQPGAARAVSMETPNKRARTAPFTCGARGAPRTNRARSLCASFVTLKRRVEIRARRTCRAAGQRGGGGGGRLGIMSLPHFNTNNCCIPPHSPL